MAAVFLLAACGGPAPTADPAKAVCDAWRTSRANVRQGDTTQTILQAVREKHALDAACPE